MKFGSHVSIRNGYAGAAKLAQSMDASAFQYFPKNPRSLSVKAFNIDDARLCKMICEKYHLVSVAHTPYPTDLTALDQHKRDKVIASLINDLDIADACGSIGVVVHYGKHVTPNDRLKSYHMMIETINDVLYEFEGDCKILIENNAGKQGTMGTSIEELVKIRELCEHPEKIGFCFDTCHAFASGLWNGHNWTEIIEKAIDLHFFEHLDVIHFNNSVYDTGHGKDRHANIFGDGYITKEQFDELMQTPQLKDIPFILETPKDNISHVDEIKLLRERWG